MLLVIWFSSKLSCKEQGVGLYDPYGSLPTQDILCLTLLFQALKIDLQLIVLPELQTSYIISS